MKILKTLPIVFASFLISHPASASLQERTIRALEELSKSGSARATFELGRHYETGAGVPESYTKAFDLYCKAAKTGHADAAYHLAQLYLHGQGVGRNRVQAAAWIERAVEKGHPYAAQLLDDVDGVNAAGAPTCSRAAGLAMAEPPVEIVRIVDALAPEFGLDPELVLAIMHAESGFRVRVVSPNNAQGLMQLIPDTASRFGVKNPFDPRDNIRGGMKYLRWLMAYFGGHVPYVLAAYNAGEGAVVKHGGIPPYKETRAYVEKILAVYPRQRHPYEPDLAQPPSTLVRLVEQAVDVETEVVEAAAEAVVEAAAGAVAEAAAGAVAGAVAEAAAEAVVEVK